MSPADTAYDWPCTFGTRIVSSQCFSRRHEALLCHQLSDVTTVHECFPHVLGYERRQHIPSSLHIQSHRFPDAAVVATEWFIVCECGLEAESMVPRRVRAVICGATTARAPREVRVAEFQRTLEIPIRWYQKSFADNAYVGIVRANCFDSNAPRIRVRGEFTSDPHTRIL